MGREIRKVPENWQHPMYTKETASRSSLIGKYRPLHDQDFETAASEWIRECILWNEGRHPAQLIAPFSKYKYYWQWRGEPPDEKYYRPSWSPEESTHIQMYETVSEGTPVTPVFATKEELVEYLITHGTFWDNGQGWSRKSAETFVRHEWAPSGISVGGKFYAPNEQGEISA